MFSRELYKQVLTEQREFILNKNTGIERSLLKEILPKIHLPHVHIITGIRRCGKSTFLRQIINHYYKDKNFYYINFEDERFLNFKTVDFNYLYEIMLEIFGKYKIFFIDEIQNINHFEHFVRRFYDNGFKFFITGSNSRLLSAELGSRLTGRYISTLLYPFNFKEYLLFNKYKYSINSMYISDSRSIVKKHFFNYLKSGGMPEYLIFKDPEILSRIYEDILIKDIAVRYKIDNILLMKEVFQYLISNLTKRFSFNFLKNITGKGSINTYINQLHYLEQSYFARIVNKFDFSLKKQIINNKKIYLLDNGFIGCISKSPSEDKGKLLENYVYNVLSCKNQVYYFSNSFECDFITQENKTNFKAYQVSWELNKNNYEREVNGLVKAAKFLNIKKGIILTSDQEDEITEQGIKITIIPVWKLSLEIMV